MSLFTLGLSIEWALIIGLLGYFIYKWIMKPYKFFDNKGIPFIKPLPLFGNVAKMILQQESVFDLVKRIYLTFENERFYGLFEMRSPILAIRDPELIKQITVKDFDHFLNHRNIFDGEDEPLFSNSLFSLQDQKWKAMRSTLSPTFTGSKMRMMFQLVEECCQSALDYLKNMSDSKKEFDMDMKEFFTRYTNDVVASSAFGINVNSLVEDNEFYQMGRKATNFSGWMAFKFFLFSNFKQVMKFFKVKLFDEKFSKYFFRLVIDAMNYRSAHGIVRPDMIQLLMEARKPANEIKNGNDSTSKSNTTEFQWTDDELVAQCFLFFIAGFETTATLMCFVAHELMENPEIQDRLIKEIDAVKGDLGDKPLTYDAIQKMKYLDMVVSETLRKWPPAVATDRVCSKRYEIPNEKTGKNIVVNPGDIIWVPINGLHYDEKYYPNPNRFDPERFNDENKGNINQFTYLPFGVGPRSCIGNRFALMETKGILVRILMNFRFEASPKSQIPIILSRKGFQLIPKGGFWLKLVSRN